MQSSDVCYVDLEVPNAHTIHIRCNVQCAMYKLFQLHVSCVTMDGCLERLVKTD